jgi:hypothetical protein
LEPVLLDAPAHQSGSTLFERLVGSDSSGLRRFEAYQPLPYDE